MVEKSPASPDIEGAGPWRFIAAARCQACGAEDRVRVRHFPGGQQRHCVACGRLDQQGGATTTDQVADAADGVQPVRVLQPPPRSGPDST